MQDGIVKHFKRVLLKTLYEHRNSRSYMLKHHLLDQMVKDVRMFGTLSVLCSIP